MLNKDQYEDEEEELDEDYNSDDLQKQTNDDENLVVNHNNNVKDQNDIKTSINNENYNKDNKDQNNNIEVTTSLDNNINTKINSSSVHDIYIDRLAFYKNKHKFDDDELKEFSNENYFYDMSSKNLHFHMIFQRGSLVDITQLSSIIACYKLRQSNSSKIIQMFISSKKEENFVPYFIFFDEFFIYFIKNLELDFIPQGDDRKAFTRTIGKSYNIKQLEKIKTQEYNEKKLKITFTFKLHSVFEEFIDEKYIIKDIYIEYADCEVFFKMLRFYLKIYKIPIVV